MEHAQLRPAVILLAALLLGLLADLLLWGSRWGLGLTLWLVMLAVLLSILFRRSRTAVPAGWQGGLAVLALIGIAAAWRDSRTLVALDVLAAAACGAVLLLRRAGVRVLAFRISELMRETVAGMIDGLIGGISLISADRAERRRRGDGRGVLPAVRGLILAVPLVITFGALYSAADPTIEYLLVTVLNIDLASAFRHAAVVSVVSWAFAGLLYGRFAASSADPLRGASAGGPAMGIVEVGIPLGALVVLSVLFVISQLAYLFGGAGYVLGAPGVTVADYARRGFFELIAVAALTLPVLVAAAWLLRNESDRRLFRVLASAQLACTLVVSGSALHRLSIYQEAFGLTESRLYAAALVIWVGAVCLIYALTVLRARTERFAPAVLLGALVVLALLHLVNPDAVIARVNLDRAVDGAELDTRYLETLTADAVPVLVGAMPGLPEPARSDVRTVLDRWRGELREGGWRDWNVSRARADRLLDAGAFGLE